MTKDRVINEETQIFYEQATIISVCDQDISVTIETKIFFIEQYSVVNELGQTITFESESRFSFCGRYAVLRTLKLRTILLSETFKLDFHRRCALTRTWKDKLEE